MRKLLFILIVALLFGCNNDDAKSELEKLPAATQLGLNKVGCLLDGKAFLPDGTPLSTNCFYQFVNGKYYFYMSVQNSIGPDLVSVVLKTEGKQIFQGETYQLVEEADGNASGLYLWNLDIFETSTIETGELYISKRDPINNIISGSFWFDVRDASGIVHQIRDGRFDFTCAN